MTAWVNTTGRGPAAEGGCGCACMKHWNTLSLCLMTVWNGWANTTGRGPAAEGGRGHGPSSCAYGTWNGLCLVTVPNDCLHCDQCACAQVRSYPGSEAVRAAERPLGPRPHPTFRTTGFGSLFLGTNLFLCICACRRRAIPAQRLLLGLWGAPPRCQARRLEPQVSPTCRDLVWSSFTRVCCFHGIHHPYRCNSASPVLPANTPIHPHPPACTPRPPVRPQPGPDAVQAGRDRPRWLRRPHTDTA